MNGTRFILAAIVFQQFCGCLAEAEPGLEVWRDGAFVPVSVGSYEITGQRDGATTRATAVMVTEDGARLHLKLELSYDPTPSLSLGSWSLNEREGGELRAESVEFTGGQGEGPSVGGVFVLEQGGEPRYRVDLPLRSIASREWRVD